MQIESWLMEDFFDIESGAFYFGKIVERFGNNPVIVTPEGLIRYSEFSHRSAAVAAELQRRRVKPGERVGIIGPNSVEYLILLMALWQTGAVAVPLSPRLPEDQISSLLEKVNCKKLILHQKFLIHDSRFTIHDISLPNHLPDFKSAIRNPQFVVSEVEPSAIPSRQKHKHPCLFVGMKTSGFQIRNPQSAIRNTLIPLDQDATAVFTSGSSGEPKAALHTFGNHIYSAVGSNLNIPFGPGDRWLLSLPLYHVGGLAILFRALVSGGAVAVADENMPLPEAIQKLGITHISLVTTQLYRLLKEDKSGEILSGLKTILLGGSAIPPSLIRAAVERRLPIHTSYGSTEMSSQITTTPPGAPLEKLFTSGTVLKYREVKIAADGEILVRGKTLFRGYWEGDSLKKPFDAQGWFASGDMGKLDEDRYLDVTGRKDNMFISGGENIQPEEIEAALCQMPEIEQAIVVPVENEEFGKRPAAFVKMRAGKPLQEAPIRRFLKKRIARFKIPDYFFPWPEAESELGIKIDRKYFQAIARERMGKLS